MKKFNERLQAFSALLKLIDNKTPLSYILQAQTEFTPFAKEMCFGVCRHYFRLQAIADCLVAKRPKVLDIWVLLLLGLYQLHYMQLPDYAVVQETVALLDRMKKTWAKGMVNAVLRRYCREKTAILANSESNQDYVYGHPTWFLQRLQRDWPDDWQAILKANDGHPPMTLRVNQQHTACKTYLERLQQRGIQARLTDISPQGLILQEPCPVECLPDFAAGDVSVQDEAAQLAVSLLSLQPGLRVLDACCAPGGKLCHILETGQQLAACVGLDINAQRLQRVRENLERLKLKATLLQGDALEPHVWWDGQLFDRILLDAPCSATGVIRRHPDIKLLRTEAEVSDLVKLQSTLLRQLWPLLSPQGLLVYATCSVLKAENELQIAQFIAEHPDCSLHVEAKPWGHKSELGWQILPGENNQDGFFYSVLVKK